MKQFLPMLYWLLPAIVCFQEKQAFSQAKDSVAKTANEKIAITTIKQQVQKPEILNGGFIDVAQNGQMNASARLFRLYIGEPGKFQVPISIFTGVSANSFSSNQQNQEFVLNLINPGTGLFNINFDGSHKIIGKKEAITALHAQYQAGFRLLSFYNRTIFNNITFFNTIAGLGMTFLTGAWERNKVNNLGLFWANFRALYSCNPAEILQSMLSSAALQNLLGYSVGMGIEISQSLNVKIFYFHFLNNRDIAAFTQPFLQLSFNYSIR